ncbi:MAG: biotin--[acetyl-CoA-carboxylase] ligase [Burkholderiaceae bacterium]|nr:biotin--[acetyl-CoA-carboxylase] ligase [Burkholderiaceae bacterium]
MAPVGAPDFLAALRGDLQALYPGFEVEYHAQIDSTNTELMRRARSGVVCPQLLVAGRQNAGRGRLGRTWQSAPQGAALTFSIGLPLTLRDWSGLSLAAGCAIAQALDPDGAGALRIKWPNDLWRQERKLAGILIETALGAPKGAIAEGAEAPRYTVVGAGINIAPLAGDGLRTAPAWVREWRPEASAPQLLRMVAPGLLAGLLRFAREGFGAFAADYAARDALRGREVCLSDGVTGRCAGVSARGELLVHTAAGMQTVTSAEISVRPRALA